MIQITLRDVAAIFKEGDPFKWWTLWWWAEQYISRCFYSFLLGLSFGFGVIAAYAVKGWLS